jgi:hypothetical protein
VAVVATMDNMVAVVLVELNMFQPFQCHLPAPLTLL